jgi:sugar lactone lactonase YvrE
LKSLHGKVVLLDFWAFCCINCMHVLPDLDKLQDDYKDSLVIIGVHSAKFSNEQSTAKIRQAILRYKIRHPVLNDHNLEVWDAYNIQAWPTFILIDAQGRIAGRLDGENAYEPLKRAIELLTRQAKGSGELKEGAMPMRLESSQMKDSSLAFPGKVLADAAGQRLFISDSNHGRVLVASLKDGQVQAQLKGLSNPQGLALSADGKTLYVAETDAGRITAFDLEVLKSKALAEKLNSPWDLCLVGDSLYVAMAGAHQIWRVDLDSGSAKPFAGSGREDLLDGSLSSANLAQPSGLSSDGKKLFSADSESSSIRAMDLDAKGSVKTLVGKGLFDFGYIEGDKDKGRLQHPLGVCFAEGKLYVADSYDNAIRIVDPAAGGVRNWLGNGLAGTENGMGRAARFNEPGGLSAANGKLYIADTNNHLIRVADLKSGSVSTFSLKGL